MPENKIKVYCVPDGGKDTRLKVWGEQGIGLGRKKAGRGSVVGAKKFGQRNVLIKKKRQHLGGGGGGTVRKVGSSRNSKNENVMVAPTNAADASGVTA